MTLEDKRSLAMAAIKAKLFATPVGENHSKAFDAAIESAYAAGLAAGRDVHPPLHEIAREMAIMLGERGYVNGSLSLVSNLILAKLVERLAPEVKELADEYQARARKALDV